MRITINCDLTFQWGEGGALALPGYSCGLWSTLYMHNLRLSIYRLFWLILKYFWKSLFYYFNILSYRRTKWLYTFCKKFYISKRQYWRLMCWIKRLQMKTIFYILNIPIIDSLTINCSIGFIGKLCLICFYILLLTRCQVLGIL